MNSNDTGAEGLIVERRIVPCDALMRRGIGKVVAMPEGVQPIAWS